MATQVTSTAAELVATLSGYPGVIKNLGPGTVYVGTSSSVTADVTSTGGYPLAPGEVLNLSAKTTSATDEIDYYAISDGITSYVAVHFRG